ncbi:MAG TPA: serine/threonine-protein kinase [Polyangiaceae bacterium]|nr:serine/threonine-protein kinase [Polyangiaceae bacterium]
MAEAIDRDLAPDDRVGEYVIQEKLGEGGFGAVYRAVHPVIGKTAAVKVLAREFSSHAETVSRFVSEARAVNTIRHKNIIDIFNFGTLEDGRHYFVMELLDGMSLDAFIAKNAPIDPPLCVEILRGVSKALDAAHAKGIAHRDLKPENIFLSFDDEGRPLPKLLDFGIAKLLGEAGAISGHKTRTGAPVGTPQYMAPEQCLGGDMDERIDVYAFGLVTFEMLTGAPPFTGNSLLELMNMHVKAKRPAVSERRPELGTSFDEPLKRMMALERDDRPSSPGAAFELLVAATRAAGWDVDTPQTVPPAKRQTSSSPLSDADTVAHAATVASGVDNDTRGPSSITIGGDARPKRVSLVVLGVAIAGAVGVYFASSGLSREETPALAPASAESPAPVESSVATSEPTTAPAASLSPSEQVNVEVRCKTNGARAFLGEDELGPVPGRFRIAKDDKRVLTVKAPGHQDFTSKEPRRDGMVIEAALKPAGRPAGVNKDLEDPFR